MTDNNQQRTDTDITLNRRPTADDLFEAWRRADEPAKTNLFIRLLCILRRQSDDEDDFLRWIAITTEMALQNRR
jgi:hypothetical protein